MSEIVTIKVPDIGNYKDVDVIDVPVNAGDTVNINDTLITLETDKATMDVPAEQAGTVVEVKIKVGDKISQGDVILTMSPKIEEKELTTSPAASKEQPAVAPTAAKSVPVAIETEPPTKTQVTPSVSQEIVSETNLTKAHAGPAVRKMARELGVDLLLVKGSAPFNRIVKEDVKAYVKNNLNNVTSTGTNLSGLDLLPWPEIDFAQFGETEIKPLSRIKKIAGKNLARNWVMIPHVTQHDDADITELEVFRKQLNQEWAKAGVKFSPLAFIIKASVTALQTFPEFNSSLLGDSLLIKKYYNIGFAADTPNGLVVPVIKDADKKGLHQISLDLTELSHKARAGKLSPHEMQGASFTISSLGGIGGTYFTPIINAPEVAILGVCRSQIKPVWDGKEFIARTICPLSLSYDHRVIDGAAACRFTTLLTVLLADLKRLIV